MALHSEPDDLREAAHADGAPVTRAESAGVEDPRYSCEDPHPS